MGKKLLVVCFLGFIYVMFLGNTFVYLRGEDADKLKTEAADDELTYLNAMNQTKIGKYFFINVNGGVQKLLGRRVIKDASGTLIKLNNGYLTTKSIMKDTSDTAAALEETYASLQEQGIDMLYVQARGVTSKEGKEFPTGMKGYANLTIDTFLKKLQEKNISYIDSYDVLIQNNVSWEQNFFKTDHHWKPEAAFNVYQKTCEILNDKYDFKIDEKYYNTDLLKKEKYEKSFLGAEGRRIGRFYAGLDDFELLYPDFQTEFTLNIPSKGIIREGSFEESILTNKEVLGKYRFDTNAYYTYLGGDYPLVTIKNHMQNNDKKIMVVKDSFGIPYSSFLALACEELNIVDVRYSEEQLGDIIKEMQPDMVIFCYGQGYIGMPKMVSLDFEVQQ